MISPDQVEVRERLTKIEQDIKAAWRRIDEQLQLAKDVHKLALAVEGQIQELRHMRDDLEDVRKDMSELQGRSGKRWEQVVTTAITGVVGAVIGAAMMMIYGG